MISSTTKEIVHFFSAASSSRAARVDGSVRKEIYSVFFINITRIHGIPSALTKLDILGILSISMVWGRYEG